MGVGISISLFFLIIFNQGLDLLPLGTLFKIIFTSTFHARSELRTTFLLFLPLGVCPYGDRSNGTKTTLYHRLCKSFPFDHIPRTFLSPLYLFFCLKF